MPRAPRGLGATGKALWRDVNTELVLDNRERALLQRACQLADRAEELEALIRSDGLMIPGSTGQQRLNPALSEQRQVLATVGRLLASLAPKAETPAQIRAVRAATRRWG